MKFYRFTGQGKLYTKASLKYIAEHIGEAAIARCRKLSYRPQMLSDDVLAFGLVES